MKSTVTVAANQVAASYGRAASASKTQIRALVRHHTHLLNTRVKRHASGRPGPNAPTGDYRRTIGTRFVETADTYTGEVGTNAPQGRRLELGFYGTDSLGRTYAQQPYPHFGPAFDETLPEFQAGARAILGRLL